MFKMNKSIFKLLKKAQLDGLVSLTIGLVVIGFVLIIGLIMLGNLRDNTVDQNFIGACNITTAANCSEAYNSSLVVINAVDDIPTWLSIVVLAFIAVVILGIIAILKRFRG